MTIYIPNIPQPNDDPTQSQSQLLGNFGKLNTDFSVNHVPFTAGGNNGTHTIVNFPVTQNADPTPAGLASALYTKTVNSLGELFFTNSSFVRQLTDLPLINSGTSYGITTPWGLIINFGVGTATSSGNPNNFAIPFPNSCFSVVANVINSANPVGAAVVIPGGGPPITSFKLFNNNAMPFGCYYIAIGN